MMQVLLIQTNKQIYKSSFEYMRTFLRCVKTEMNVLPARWTSRKIVKTEHKYGGFAVVIAVMLLFECPLLDRTWYSDKAVNQNLACFLCCTVT